MSATLHLLVGLPAAGKTTLARRLEREHRALRLTKDEWMKALYGDDNPEDASDVVEGRLIEIGLRVLELGQDVVIDFGLWGKDERTALRWAALERDARPVLHLCSVSPREQRRRLDRRMAESPLSTWPVSEEEISAWTRIFQEPTPAELDGSEPLDPPPAGFADWDQWRHDRWPHRRAAG